MDRSKAYTFLFNIENSLGKLSVFKLEIDIEHIIHCRIKEDKKKNRVCNEKTGHGELRNFLIHFFRHLAFPIEKKYEDATRKQNPIFSYKKVEETLSSEEIDAFSQLYIEHDKHLKQLVLNKKIELKENESSSEFLYRLIIFKNTVFNQEAYEILMSCIKMGDFSEWEKYRKSMLYKGNRQIYLKEVKLIKLNLTGVDFGSVHLEKSLIIDVCFKDANLMNVYLDDARVEHSDFSGADMSYSSINGCSFSSVNLSGTGLLYSRANSKTGFWACDISKKTDMELVNWESAKYDPGLKQLVEKINRKKKWEEWYNVHSILRFPSGFFWWLTDYGTSITRLLFSFFAISFFFGVIYHSVPGLVDGLQGYDAHPNLRFLRSIYFSIVTMTTLGFGDIHAIKNVECSTPIAIAIGHILLILQVLIGYFILGALITFMGVLFKSPGPIQPYSEVLPHKKRLEWEEAKQSKYESKRYRYSRRKR